MPAYLSLPRWHILAVANIVAVAFAILLDNVGRVLPGLTGRGQLVRQPEAQRKAEELVEEEEDSELTMDDIAVAIFLAGG